MKAFTYRIEDQNGLHARPAGKLANCAKQFTASIRVGTAEKEADGKRLLSLMSLGAVQGTELHFSAEGEDEEEAATALERFCKEQWGDGIQI